MEKCLGNSPTKMELNLSRELENSFYSLQALGCGTGALLHLQVSPVRPRLLSPSLSFTGGNSLFCHWTTQERGGKEKKEKNTLFCPPF